MLQNYFSATCLQLLSTSDVSLIAVNKLGCISCLIKIGKTTSVS